MKASWKNYALTGNVKAQHELTDEGFEAEVEQQWYSAKVERKVLKQLIKRSDVESIRYYALWLGLLMAAGIGAYLTWGTVWAWLWFAVYGVLYSAADHRHHELSHGTPFKTRWLNDGFFHLCAFMTLREGFYYRWSHTRHHTHTVLVGKDPEIAAPRPPHVLGIVSDLFFIKDGVRLMTLLVRHSFGNLTADGKQFVPAEELPKIICASRLYLVLIGSVGAACVASASILPGLLVVLPRFYGGFFSQLFNITQHAGLAEDVHDHRLNTRTIYMNPVYQFLYSNMNYHIEHHMFPMVPYYKLPELHGLIKDQCPPAYPSLSAALQEMVPALLKQTRDPAYFVQRSVPSFSVETPTATHYESNTLKPI
ncbi:MAG TPA: fatty acid desaturase [Thiolinea sp.]|mgnify:CR=1 FL=1|nr:fatty acid desaturase [Thiolinea sp.]